MRLKQVSIRPRAPKASPAKSARVTAMAANAHLAVTVVIALSKASVKSAQCVKHLLPKRKPRVSPASLTLPLKQQLP